MWMDKQPEPQNENAKDKILRLLSQAWMIYVTTSITNRNYDKFLKAIQEAQIAVFEEN